MDSEVLINHGCLILSVFIIVFMEASHLQVLIQLNFFIFLPLVDVPSRGLNDVSDLVCVWLLIELFILKQSRIYV